MEKCVKKTVSLILIEKACNGQMAYKWSNELKFNGSNPWISRFSDYFANFIDPTIH